MAVDASGPTTHDTEVVGTLDSDGSREDYVIADITDDGAWVSMRAEHAATLRDWR